MRPKLLAGTMLRERVALARRQQTSTNPVVVVSSSKTMRKVSNLRPDGTAAAPFRVLRRAVMSLSGDRLAGGVFCGAGCCALPVS